MLQPPNHCQFTVENDRAAAGQRVVMLVLAAEHPISRVRETKKACGGEHMQGSSGKRLAEAGYSVLVVNPFYRSAIAPVVPEGADIQAEPR